MSPLDTPHEQQSAAATRYCPLESYGAAAIGNITCGQRARQPPIGSISKLGCFTRYIAMNEAKSLCTLSADQVSTMLPQQQRYPPSACDPPSGTSMPTRSELVKPILAAQKHLMASTYFCWGPCGEPPRRIDSTNSCHHFFEARATRRTEQRCHIEQTKVPWTAQRPLDNTRHERAVRASHGVPSSGGGACAFGIRSPGEVVECVYG
jgi:hypothetical protein